MRTHHCILASLTIILLCVSDINAASTTLSWTATGDDIFSGQATVYDVRYSLSMITDANWANATKVTGLPTPKVSGSVETIPVTGLTSNTTYYFALKVGDEIPNWSALSNVTSKAITEESIPPSAISNLGAANETSTSVTLSWTAPGDDGDVGTASQYDIRYSTAVITAANFSLALKTALAPTPKIAGLAESFTVNGLSAGTTYHFAIKTADEVPNWAAISNVVSRTTLVVAPPGVPTLVSPANGAVGVSTNPSLTWTASSGATSYRLQLSTSSSFATTVLDRSGLTSTTLAVTGLSANTTYFWRVSASNAGGTSAYSSARRFTTLAVAPPAAPTLVSPANGAVGVSTNPSLTWTASSGATSYRLQLSTSSSFATTVRDQSGLTSTTLAVTGLSANTTYFWRVSASNAGGTSAYSLARRFTTLAVAPPAAPTLVSPANGAVGVSINPSLTWTASSGATSYRLQLSTSSTFATTVLDRSGLTSTTLAVTGLSNSTHYYWHVRASNASGTSAYSSIRQFATIAIAPAPPAMLSPLNVASEDNSAVDNIIPSEFALGQNYPNPFNPTTRIDFSLPSSGQVTIEIFNILGEKVKTIVNSQMGAGNHTVEWNSTGGDGNHVSSGIYFYRLTTGDFIQTKKMILLK